MKFRLLAISAMFALAITANAFACGDSLYRVGKGMSYRTYSAPLPGNLLVLGSSSSVKQLAEELARSGHEVHLVANAEELAAEFEHGDYDVVIASFSERQSVERIAGSSSYLPIASAGEEERLAKRAYSSVMVSDKHEIKHYLRAIHRALKDSA